MRLRVMIATLLVGLTLHLRAGAHELSTDDVGAFFDGLIPQQLARNDMAGAVVIVVKDGKTLFAKGYGHADVANKTPVTPDRTLFRTGSTGKLFTWTAVMQLVEQGKLDLDRDVNDYLDFRIPASFPQPITLRHLMTHTGGFEETVEDLFYPDAAHIKPLGEFLKTHVPGRIFPPGTTPAYSNYGAALAGYIVQRTSGEPYEEYIENHIFNPLGMAHSTFRQPLPAALQPLMSNGYVVASSPPGPFELISVAPAGAASNTAEDLARFMRAQLEGGQLDGAQILRPETVQLMQSRQFANVPELNAMALGFYEESRNGHRIIGHGGDTLYFHGDLHLIPDAGLGFYIGYNSSGREDEGLEGPRIAAWHAFLDRYFPYDIPAATAPSSGAQDAAQVAGRYLVSRRGETTIVAGLWTLLPILEPKVFSNADGTLSVTGFKGADDQLKRYREIGPLLYQEVDGQGRIAFKREDSGRMRMLIDYPFMVFQKTRWYENSVVNFVLAGAASAVLVLTLLLWPLTALIRRHYGVKTERTPSQRRLRLLVRVVCALDLTFLGIFAAFLVIVLSSQNARQTAGGDFLLHLLQLVGWLGVLGSLVALYNAWVSWRTPGRGVWSRIGDTTIALACMAFVWIAFMWNLLHWNVRF
jgi:CubicO group peptidase (beta-lactamase class C family)